MEFRGPIVEHEFLVDNSLLLNYSLIVLTLLSHLIIRYVLSTNFSISPLQYDCAEDTASERAGW